MEEKPLILLAGYSAYPRKINFKKFREIADKCGAVLMVDMAHFAGRVLHIGGDRVAQRTSGGCEEDLHAKGGTINGDILGTHHIEFGDRTVDFRVDDAGKGGHDAIEYNRHAFMVRGLRSCL